MKTRIPIAVASSAVLLLAVAGCAGAPQQPTRADLVGTWKVDLGYTQDHPGTADLTLKDDGTYEASGFTFSELDSAKAGKHTWSIDDQGLVLVNTTADDPTGYGSSITVEKSGSSWILCDVDHGTCDDPDAS